MDTYPKSRAHYSLVHQVRGWYSGVELKMSRRQAAGAYLNRYLTDEQRSRRLIFSSTPWGHAALAILGRCSLDPYQSRYGPSRAPSKNANSATAPLNQPRTWCTSAVT